MYWIIDVILILSAVLCIIIYTHKGFVKSVFGLCKYGISLLLSYLLAPLVGNVIYENYEMESVFISNAMAYILVFFASLLSISLVALLLDKVCDLPILKQLNKFMGFVLGVLCAAINLVAFCSLISVALHIVEIKYPQMSVEMVSQSTVIFGYINDLDIITHLISLLKGMY